MSFLRSKPDPLAGVMHGITPEPDVSMPAPIAQAPQDNALQALTGGPANAPQPPQAQAPVAAAPPRSRRSILDTIGRLSDVFAKVGGAEALYQPTLDGREDRTFALGDHAKANTLTDQKIQSGALDNTTQAGKMTGQALRGVQALIAANPQADVAKIWPIIAAQAGVDPEHIQAIGNTLATDPAALEGLAAALNGDDKAKYSGQVIYGRDAQGNLKAFQANTQGGQAREVSMGEGFSPVDPQQFVNTGGATVGIGKNSGRTQIILPNSEKPGAAADRQQRGQIAGDRNATAITIAGMPARAKSGTAADDKPAAAAQSALHLLDSIESGFVDLHKQKALAGDNGGIVNNVLQGLGRSTAVGEYIGQQTGAPAAQKRIEINKNVSLLQQELIKALPASATRTKFEQEILRKSLPDPANMSYSTAQNVIKEYRDIYNRAVAAAKPAAPAARRPAGPARVAPRKGGPSVSNW